MTRLKAEYQINDDNSIIEDIDLEQSHTNHWNRLADELDDNHSGVSELHDTPTANEDNLDSLVEANESPAYSNEIPN